MSRRLGLRWLIFGGRNFSVLRSRGGRDLRLLNEAPLTDSLISRCLCRVGSIDMPYCITLLVLCILHLHSVVTRRQHQTIVWHSTSLRTAARLMAGMTPSKATKDSNSTGPNMPTTPEAIFTFTITAAGLIISFVEFGSC